MILFSNGRIYFLILFFLVLLPLESHSSSVPELVHYEGFLSDSNGYAVPDGDYDVTFRLHDAFTGGITLWIETWDGSTSRVPVVNGRFRILLGSHEPLTSSFFQQNPNTFLGITIGNDSEMTPRQRIASVPYALSSPGSTIPSGIITMWSGAINDIPAGWALCDGTNGTPDLRDRFVVGAGSTFSLSQQGGTASSTISLDVPNHRHSISGQSLTTAGGGSGQESARAPNERAENSGFTRGGWWARLQTNHTHAISSHNHGGNTAYTDTSAVSTTIDTVPPYFALAFIMKL